MPTQMKVRVHVMRNALSETTSFHIYRIHRRDGHDTAEQERIREEGSSATGSRVRNA